MGAIEQWRERRDQRRYELVEYATRRPTIETTRAVARSRQETTVILAREDDAAVVDLHRVRAAEDRAAQRGESVIHLADDAVNYADRRGRLIGELLDQGRTADAFKILDIRDDVLSDLKEVRRDFIRETAPRCRVL